VSDPKLPSESSPLTIVPTVSRTWNLQVDGDLALVPEGNFVSFEPTSFGIYDLTAPAIPVKVGGVSIPYGVTTLAAKRGKAFLALEYDGVYVIDYSSQSNPSIEVVWSYAPEFWPAGLLLEGDFLYAVQWADLDYPKMMLIIDPSDTVNPQIVGTYNSIGAATNIAIEGGYAYLPDSYELEIVSISDPNAPVSVSKTAMDYVGGDIRLSGNHAFMTGFGFNIANIASASNPVAVYHASFGGQHLSVAGNYAYVADGYYGIRILDVSDPASPFQVGNIGIVNDPWSGVSLWDHAKDVAVFEDVLYGAGWKDGWMVAGRRPKVDRRYVQAAPGTTVNYEVSWHDGNSTSAQKVMCRVSGGSCSVTSVDLISKAATIEWNLPGTLGHEEILFIVGHWPHFVTDFDRVVVQ
jgi:hypothetical protein